MLEIAGYEGSPLVDGSRFLDLPLFWPCHFGSSLWGEEAQAVAFGPDWDDAQELYRTLSSPDEWPAFTVHLHSGYALHVVYRNMEGDHGVDYLLSHPDWAEAVTLATDDGHFMGPGLSWPELEASADQTSTSGVGDPDARLLLLFPVLGDADVPETAAPRLAAALERLTIVEDPAGLARALLENQGQWTPASWRQVDDTWICDGSHSFRNPANHFVLAPSRLAAVSRALREI
ncbi:MULTISPECIES: hypothetical protein [unclassified Streptomyces]|uniref:hypothetical protein n=1 Tax=unclassified Streptomyces TaxID=2593676 RepID=UPI002259B5C3|nr:MULTISPECIES: hypothetical protein [unclassified Streptomyces]MCX5140095.1 hypothetical protein [Streptomyces sp. NBC_00338]WRZ64696.1 hypothetical protein OG408_12705 [Streptomyces sp. NBC_01257]